MTKEDWVQTPSVPDKEEVREGDSQGERVHCNTGPRVFLCGKKRLAGVFQMPPVVLPNAASEHCQDLDSLGPVPKQSMRRAEKKTAQ